MNKLEQWIGELIQTKSTDLIRYKGALAVKGKPEKFAFQGVRMLFSGGFSDALWKPEETRECRFVFIGRDLGKPALHEGFMRCRDAELSALLAEWRHENLKLKPLANSINAIFKKKVYAEKSVVSPSGPCGSHLLLRRFWLCVPVLLDQGAGREHALFKDTPEHLEQGARQELAFFECFEA